MSNFSSEDQFYDAPEALSTRNSHSSRRSLVELPKDSNNEVLLDRNTDSYVGLLQVDSVSSKRSDSSISSRKSRSSSSFSHAIDPISTNIIQRTFVKNGGKLQFRRPEPVQPAMYIYKESTGSSDEQSQIQWQDSQHTIGEEKKSKLQAIKGSIVAHMGRLGKYKLRGRDNSDNSAEKEDGNTSNTSSSTSSDHRYRRSGESSHSTLFGHIASTGLTNPILQGARYVKLKSRTRPGRDLGRILHAQTLNGKDATGEKPRHRARTRAKELLHHSFTVPSGIKDSDLHSNTDESMGAIWVMKFSQDGRYIAAGGQKCVIRIWKTRDGQGPTNEDGHRRTMSDHDIASRQTIKVFNDEPVREFEGHTGDILDISWSKKHFLLSSSMDNNVMLWHISVQQCLCVFKHLDFVTSVAFHPFDDRLFLSGSADGKVRIFSIPSKSVIHCNSPPDNNIITAVNFTADGKKVCAGTYDGQLFIYDTEDMKLLSQVLVKKRNARRGYKITGIQALPGPPNDNNKILVTSNDSIVRLYDINDQRIVYKYKGSENESTQIKATFSDDGQLVVCGSDKNSVHIWSTNPHESPDVTEHSTQSDTSLSHLITLFPDPISGNSRNSTDASQHRRSRSSSRSLSSWFGRTPKGQLAGSSNYYFSAHHGTVTCAIFAPTKARQQLAATGEDTIYNHTHIPYMRRGSESASSQNDRADGHHRRNTMRMSCSMLSITNNDKEELKARLEHPYTEGHIIVTTDEKGCIKVWRIDSGVYEANEKQRHTSNSDTSNSFSNNLTPLSTMSGTRRESSDNSVGPLSRLSLSRTHKK
ncbi:WD40-repeat-containing domain protein [Fennellomyces sp. T-0311]|nr:WD40-repeat-containing domain protein [Fennellomyces sp. T-0311]